MSSISQINTATAAATSTAGATGKKNVENPQDRFLKLLITQMKNQDPLKPLDNAEVTSQLAQISTVSGLDKLNSTLQQLVS
ncbi:MAG: flagellar biosynthesis protein FlgD, partial [Betaproteobacteria bacterium]|nr:flagellar biosynthesis protein FlgD [Betaproteobacteria bacterium]